MALPLEDVTVADFTKMMQGGWATQKLADMGAEVIKIEQPGGEFNRSHTVGGDLYQGVGPFFLAMNRNKRSIELNLKNDEGLEVAQRIIKNADVLMENFRPGVMERLGLGFEQVKEINTEIVYVSASGYGADGPYSDRPGQDLLVQALSGLAKKTGRKDDPPTAAGTYIGDELSATNLALHTVIALYHKKMTGEGQKVEVNLFDTMVDAQCQEITATLNLEREFSRSEENVSHPTESAPYGIYETEDGHIAIAIAPLEELGDSLGIEELAEYASGDLAYDSRDEIFRIIESHTRENKTEDLLEQLLEDDHWVAKVQNYSDLSEDPQIEHNDMLVDVEHPEVGTYKTTGIPAKFSETPGEIRSPPPQVGEHTETILSELGYDDEDIGHLNDIGAIGDLKE
ncbi:CaiB/BaiF CoA transferase family protein [Haloarcula marina]|uniref:CaiB/BaiF CoA transferase family protein n=1 Tax=Haloarcula marina TaxID=2961574 RepID=UPI0020B68473|nr:CaiB/BaiF CoA-transferase family protein [Halomicroarcula marina]